LTRAKFSTASDVWSYGVVLWEIYSLGKIPWDRLSPIEIRDLLLRGERLARPDRCPLDMYEVMLDCWNPTAQDRPTFGILVQRVETVSACIIVMYTYSYSQTLFPALLHVHEKMR
jgi:serine/threonine protein kinase